MKVTFSPEELQELANNLADKLFPLIKELLKNEDEILTFEEACSFLKCNKSWLYKKVQYKEVPHIKMGRYLRFSKKELEKWIKNRSF